MKELPDILRRVPTLLYASAALIFVWSIANSYLEMTAYNPFPDPSSSLETYFKSNALLNAFERAIYLIGSGAIVHVLIAIYDRTGVDKEAAE